MRRAILPRSGGRNQIHRYSNEDESVKRYEQELSWVSAINDALENDRFTLFYQHCRPLNKAIDGDYYEILLRLQNEDGSLVPQAPFCLLLSAIT